MGNIEVKARYCGERMRWDECGLGTAQVLDASWELVSSRGVKSRTITVKGDSEPDELLPGVSYVFYGQLKTYRDEKQLWFNSFQTHLVHDEEGIVTYLTSVGKGLGLGRATARKAWMQWGAKAVEHLRENPLDACELGRISVSQAEQLGERLLSLQATESSMIKLTSLLHGRGFPKTLPRQCIRSWGARAAETVRNDPYRLMQFRGCGFAMCDKLYLELDHDPKRLRRQALRAWYELASDGSGDTWFPAERAKQAIRSIGAPGQSGRAIELSLRLGQRAPGHYGALAAIGTDGSGHLDEFGSRVWLAEGKKAEQERRLAGCIAKALQESPSGSLWPDASALEVDEHQREQLAKATIKNIGILGGSPGTGKTYTVAQLVKAILRSGKVLPEEIAIGAPTGKAAVRLTESLQAAGLQFQAKTWHSLLKVSEQNSESGRFGFFYGNDCKWPFKVLIGDEFSMNDIPLSLSIFEARRPGCHLLLVGDVNQLPPVGHGAPLRDMRLAGLPQGELTEIKRSSGGIVEACKAIREGERWTEGDNLKLIEAETPDKQLACVREILESSVGDFDSVWSTQVISAVNLRSPLSRKILNKTLQPLLNPSASNATGGALTLDDKVVCLSNGFYKSHISSPNRDSSSERGEYVANGEVGCVVDVEDRQYVIRLNNPDRIVTATKKENGGSFELAYALSCHKSQGSEWPVVIVMLDDYPGARMICDRSWIYTAISRAKHQCYLVGKRSIADAMCRRNNIGRRKTFLRELIGLEQVNQQLLELGVAG